MARMSAKPPWDGYIGHHAQMGGIETSVLDNGPGRGTRIAWINTGTGLRYKVVIDRGLDIVDAFYNQYSLAWISHGGTIAPRPDAHEGIEWLYTFSGGLLTTCGLSHMGAPDPKEGLGLHGRISNYMAEIESIVQPDPVGGRLDFSITGLVRESRVFGPNLELRRTISGRLGEAAIIIQDAVTNRSNTPMPHMILYHCNFGWPLVAEGTEIIYQGTCQSRGLPMDDGVFSGKRSHTKCPAPLECHRGGGEGCGFIDVKPDKKGLCHVGLINSRLGLGVAMCYLKKQLPCLANWQHFGPGEYVTGIEPGTNPPIGQTNARQEGSLITLKPGESRNYDLAILVLDDKQELGKFRRFVKGK